MRVGPGLLVLGNPGVVGHFVFPQNLVEALSRVLSVCDRSGAVCRLPDGAPPHLRRGLVLLVVCGRHADAYARHIHSLSVNLRLITCLALTGRALFAPRSQVPKLRLTLTDLLVAALLISFNISPLLAGEFVPLGCVDLMRIWVVPYVIGRIAGSSTESLNRVMPFVVSICLALSFAGVLEAVTRINVLNHLFNHWAFTEVRWGLRRASVNVAQPIPFGFMIVLMSPIGFEAARRARLGIGPSWWRYMPLIMGAGVFSSMSRAPQLAYLLTCSGVYFFRTPKMRVPVLAALLILAAGLLVFRDTTKQLLHRAAPHEYHATIRIDGKPYHYSGTLHRELLFVVYKDSLLCAGWFGYGDRELSEIPYQKTVVGMNFWSIDDHYIWYVLRKGWLGVALFLLLGLTGSYNLARLALQLDAPGSMLAAAACSAILAVLLLLFTVLMIPAPGDVMLFWIGFGAKLARTEVRSRRDRANLRSSTTSPCGGAWCPATWTRALPIPGPCRRTGQRQSRATPNCHNPSRIPDRIWPVIEQPANPQTQPPRTRQCRSMRGACGPVPRGAGRSAVRRPSSDASDRESHCRPRPN